MAGQLATAAFDHQHPHAPDNRMQRPNLNARNEISPWIRWEGMQVYVVQEQKTYQLVGGIGNEYWRGIAADIDAPVTSVNGRTGDVVLDKDDVGLSNVDNTSDVNKPISNATQSALNNKEDAFSKGNIVEGSGVSIDGDLTGRLVGSGDITINSDVESINIVPGEGIDVDVNEEGEYIISSNQAFFTSNFTYDGESTTFTLPFVPIDIDYVTVNGVILPLDLIVWYPEHDDEEESKNIEIPSPNGEFSLEYEDRIMVRFLYKEI